MRRDDVGSSHVRACQLALAAALALGGCPRSQEPKQETVAHLRDLEGTVWIDKQAGGDLVLAQPEEPLHAGDIVSTDEEGAAVVAFSGGNLVELGSRTSLLIQAAAGLIVDFGAIVLTGTARATSGGQGIRLILGTPFGLTVLGDQPTDLVTSTAYGVRVILGDVTLLGTGREPAEIQAGEIMQLDGLVVHLEGSAEKPADSIAHPANVEAMFSPTPKPEKEGLPETKPSLALFLSDPDQSEIKRADTQAWSTPARRTPLASGDEVRTQSAEAYLQLGRNAEVTLAHDAHVVFGQARLEGAQVRASYGLRSGRATIAMRPGGKGPIEHDLDVAGHQVKLRSGLREGHVEVFTDSATGLAELAVRFGSATFDNGTVVEAGRLVRVGPEGHPGKPVELTQTNVQVSPDKEVELRTRGSVPAVRFGWTRMPGVGPYAFELARDQRFRRLVAAEQLQSTSLILDQLSAGRYFWRVRRGAAVAGGAISMVHDTDSDPADYRRSNLVRDNGESTVIYYQQSVPDITVTWDPVKGAASYRLKVFADGEFDAPTINVRCWKPQHTIPANTLEEGTHFWHVVALRRNDSEVQMGRMNMLQIEFDNTVSALVIKAPRDGDKISAETVVTIGEAELGVQLLVNGTRAKLDEAGRFRHLVQLKPGRNLITYLLTNTGQKQRYYFRSVQRSITSYR